MEIVSTWPAFFLAVLLISASPGPAMALILRRAALHGLRGAVPTVLGLELGLFLWALAAGGGFAALVAASEAAHLVLRVGGAGVLLYLGIRSWRAAWALRSTGGRAAAEVPSAPVDEPHHGASDDAHSRPRPRPRRAFVEGVLVQLANPKAAVFMLALYPQFVPEGHAVFATTALLGALQVSLEIVLYLGLAAGVARASGWFRRSTVRRRLEAASGTVLIGLGLRVAATSR